MENQPNTPIKKTNAMFWKTLGMGLSTFGVIILIAVFFMAYRQLNCAIQNTNKVTQQLQNQYAEIKPASDDLTEQVKALKTIQAQQTQAIQNIQKSQALLSEEAMKQIKSTYLKLMSIDEKLDQLPIQTRSANSAFSESPATDLSFWKKIVNQIWIGLQKIIIIRHYGDNESPLILPEQREFLFQNLHAKCETAIWGLLHHDALIYQTSLKRLQTWIKYYFVQDSPVTQSVLASLTDLQNETMKEE